MQEEKMTQLKKRMTEERFLELLKECQFSGENEKQFCQRKGMNHHTFVYWKRKLNSKQKKGQHFSFSKARISSASSAFPNTVRMILTNGVQIIIPADQEASVLSSVLRIIGFTSC